MFTNIGKKIKIIAIATCIFFLVLSIILGLIIVMSAPDAAIVGILVMLIYPLVGFMSSAFIYGFGHLIELTQSNNKILKKLASGEKQSSKTKACANQPTDINMPLFSSAPENVTR
ncbi:MAG: hypothetical protein J6L81_09055 [Clostridia bacterium]|nr:hypothetical protein [Clostridia bacterium]